jgi:hypothetical protein
MRPQRRNWLHNACLELNFMKKEEHMKISIEIGGRTDERMGLETEKEREVAGDSPFSPPLVTN